MSANAFTFRERLARPEPLYGSFIKTPTGHATEILGTVGFDFVVVDEEHAPFDRGAIDQALVAARAAGIEALVRVSSATPPCIQAALDGGAAGVVVPHVISASHARQVVGLCRYRGGKRGFSNSPRAGRYGGRSISEHVEHGDATAVVVAQIEDAESLEEVAEIAATEGVNALLVGRGDLAVAMGEGAVDAAPVLQASRRIGEAARAAGTAFMVAVGSEADARAMRAIGATAFVYSSDQGLMRRAAIDALQALAAL